MSIYHFYKYVQVKLVITFTTDVLSTYFLLSPAATQQGDMEMPGMRPSIHPCVCASIRPNLPCIAILSGLDHNKYTKGNY